MSLIDASNANNASAYTNGSISCTIRAGGLLVNVKYDKHWVIELAIDWLIGWLMGWWLIGWCVDDWLVYGLMIDCCGNMLLKTSKCSATMRFFGYVVDGEVSSPLFILFCMMRPPCSFWFVNDPFSTILFVRYFIFFCLVFVYLEVRILELFRYYHFCLTYNLVGCGGVCDVFRVFWLFSKGCIVLTFLRGLNACNDIKLWSAMDHAR